MMHSVAREADLWRLLVRVRGLRVRRRLRALADARRCERAAAAVVAEQVAALERHAEARLRALAFCRHERSGGGQWHATLRAHDARTPALHRQLGDAQHAHATARHAAQEALRGWRVERIRHEDAMQRWGMAVARVVRGDQDDS